MCNYNSPKPSVEYLSLEPLVYFTQISLFFQKMKVFKPHLVKSKSASSDVAFSLKKNAENVYAVRRVARCGCGSCLAKHKLVMKLNKKGDLDLLNDL